MSAGSYTSNEAFEPPVGTFSDTPLGVTLLPVQHFEMENVN